MNKTWIDIPDPEWTQVEGIDVLRVRGSKYVAVPVSGRKNARAFQVIDLEDRTGIVCQLGRNEVLGDGHRIGWLRKAAKGE